MDQENVSIKTIIHWREALRYFVVCVLLIPLLMGGLVWLAQRFVSVPLWMAILLGIVSGLISSQVYMAVRPKMWHFESRRSTRS